MRLKDGGYRLRDNTLFHLYVSTSPCGDARLNSPYEITTDRKRWHFYVFGSPMLCWVPHCLCPDPVCVVCGVWRVACGVWCADECELQAGGTLPTMEETQ